MNAIVRGDTKPDLEITLLDEAGIANFTSVTASAVRVRIEQGSVLVVDDNADAVTPSADGKTAVVRRAWGPGETDLPGRMWITVVVDWGADGEQTFPADGPLRLDVERAAGDA